ncbi:hypothetical protein [Streptomyces sp. NPDC051561]|uniref:hypothetical protein n=1 Tax=Streptomyces sp. NPDC051561 TaxID=3365658 RepID=UPI0037A7DE24
MDDESFESMVQALESEINAERAKVQAAYALVVVELAGLICRTAVSAGVPSDLAREMTSDYWVAVMSTPHTVIEGDED